MKSCLDPCAPVKSLFEAFSLDIKLEDGPLAVGGGVVTTAMLLEESIEAVFWGVLFTAHEHHWDTEPDQQRRDGRGKSSCGVLKKETERNLTIAFHFWATTESDFQYFHR